MGEVKRYELEVTVNFECPSGDGGHMIYLFDPSKDEPASSDAYVHYCSNQKDGELYKLPAKYPNRQWQALDVDAIPGLKI